MVTMADSSYYRLFAGYSKRDNFDVVFRSALEDVADKVDFSWIKSCLAFGPGSGEREMEFVRRLMPNLQSFVAVERDHESIKVLRKNFEEGQLPGVQSSVVETSLESWSGANSPVDAVLFINVLAHVNSADRNALFLKMTTRYLNSRGAVVIVDNSCTMPSGYLLPIERLVGKNRDVYEVMEKEMLDAGFHVVLTEDLRIHRDLRNPNDEVV